jgi:hypothetical protein
MNPQIISSYDGGKHNANLEETVSRLTKDASYKDLSTIIIVPALGSVPTKAVASWLSMYSPPNQKVIRLFAVGMEVGEAYSRTIESILAHPELSQFKYILTLEHDNIPPADGLVKLLMRMEEHPEYACIGGLYFTKGHGGVAQIWGNHQEHPLNFKPMRPDTNSGLVECNGTGMGFNLWRTAMFKDERLRKPWFKTTSDSVNGCYTQDLYAWTDFKKHGYRCAIDCGVKVGHYDLSTDITW